MNNTPTQNPAPNPHNPTLEAGPPLEGEAEIWLEADQIALVFASQADATAYSLTDDESLVLQTRPTHGD